MKIQTTSPYQFTAGELLDPDRHGLNTVYARDAINDVTSRRYSHAPIVFQYMQSCATGYTDALTQEERTFRFSCPNAMLLERAFLRYLGSGTSVQIVMTDTTTGLAPPGVSNPILVTTASAATSTQTSTFVYPVPLIAGHTYTFEITASGVFAAELAELELHVRSDRFIPTSSDAAIDPSIVLLSEQNDLGAATFNSTVSPMTTAAANNFGNGSYVAALKPLTINQHQFSSATSVALLRFDLPRVTNTNRRENLIRVFLAGVMPGATVGAGGQTLTLQMQNAAGAVLTTTTLALAGLTKAQTSATIAVDLGSATADIKTNTAADYRMVLATNNATALFKGYAIIFVE